MKYLYKTLFFLTFTPFIIFAQNSDVIKNPDKHPKLSVGIVGGSYTQVLEMNGAHLTNLPAYAASLSLDYRTSDLTYLKTNFQKISAVSFQGLSFESYKIPLLFGVKIFSGERHKSDINLLSEVGFYYRGIINFNNSTNIEYTTNNVFGVQFSFGVRYDVSHRMFTILSLRANQDFDDVLEATNNIIGIENSFGLEVGFGFRF